MAGGNSTEVTVSTYWATLHFVLGHGPFDYIRRIYIQDKEAWSGETAGGSIAVYKPELFGGLSREGGVGGQLDIDMGYTNQTPNAHLSSVLGSIPAFRGVVSAIFNQGYLGLNYYLKPWSFVASRIHKRYDGNAQWQNAYSEITVDKFYATLSTNMTTTTTAITISSAVNISLLYKNAIIQIDGLKFINNVWETVPEYMQVTSISGLDLTVTRGVLGSEALAHTSSQAITSLSSKLMNPIHVLRECITDPYWGLGYPEYMVDETSWVAAAQTVYNEKLGFAWYWKSEQSIVEFIDEVRAHVQATIYLDKVSEVYKIELFRKISDTSGLPEITENNITNVESIKRSTIFDMPSSITVKFTDGITGISGTATVSDYSLQTRQGQAITKTQNYSGVTDASIAHRLALRDLQQSTVPLYSVKFKCDRIAENYYLGKAFKLTLPSRLPNTLIMRVTSLNLGSLLNGEITVEAIEDSFLAADISYQPPPPSGWTIPINDPVPISYRKVIEIPYYLLARYKGDAFAQGIASTSTFFACTGVSPTQDSIDFGIWVAAPTTYNRKATGDFCYSALLDGTLDKISTTITVTSEIDPELLTVGDIIQINDELLQVTGKTGLILSLNRGILDTVPGIHAIGDRIFGWGFLGTDFVEYLTSETINVKETTRTMKGELDVSAAAFDSLPFAGRMHFPYPPGNLIIEGNYWPTSLPNGNIFLEWTSRNRLQQTTAPLDYYSASVTSEAGITYSGELIRTDTSAVLASFSGETGLSRTINSTYVGEVKLSVWSTNTNGDSTYKVEHTFNLT